MHPQSPKLLEEILCSCRYITIDTEAAELDTWLDDRRLRQVVERNLEIIGDALSRIRAVDEATSARTSRINEIIGLRNRIAHGYDEEVNDERVWHAVRMSLPTLLAEVEDLVPPFE